MWQLLFLSFVSKLHNEKETTQILELGKGSLPGASEKYGIKFRIEYFHMLCFKREIEDRD